VYKLVNSDACPRPTTQEEQGVCDWVREGGTLLATWDDHDFGENDAGRHYSHIPESRQIFLDFWRVAALSPRRLMADGVYTVELYGPADQQLQVIILDTRC
jgi:alkaline phosphatase D